MIHCPQNIKAICHSNPDWIFTEDLSHYLKVRSISLFVVCLKYMPGDISILKFNNILHWQTPSCPRPTSNRRYFTLFISFSSTAASHIAGLGFCLCKFTSPQSLQLRLLVATTSQFWPSLSQDCCFLECPVKPAQRDVEFGWFSLCFAHWSMWWRLGHTVTL